MRIAVFGLGYVGAVTAVCLAENGHQVWGVDENNVKIDWMSQGIPPINEPGFAERLQAALIGGRFAATKDAAQAIASTEIALVCVGTPISEAGGTRLDALRTVTRTIDESLGALPHPYTVVIRSTIPPGTMEHVVLPDLKKARTVLGEAFRVCFNPEFLREGTAIDDFLNPPYTVLGLEDTGPSSDALASLIESSYCTNNGATIRLNFREAELLKIVSNAFHALKIAFANEVGTLAARLGANSSRLMDAFVLDTKLNVSAAYLRPGFAFGGSCLAKDIRTLQQLAHNADLDFPVCQSILWSNETHLRRALAAVLTHPGPIVGLAGLVFKPHTDDVRESPAVWLARRILDAGRKLLVFEPEIDPPRLVGANLNFIRAHFPEYDHCLVSWDALKRGSDLIAAVRPGVMPTEETITQPVIRLYRVESLCEKTSLTLSREENVVEPWFDGLRIES